MNTRDIWKLPKDKRLSAFLDRYLELDEWTGNRTLQEKEEMAEIADAVMPALIRFVMQTHGLLEKWRPQATSTFEDLQKFAEGNLSKVPIAGTFGICSMQLESLLVALGSKSGIGRDIETGEYVNRCTFCTKEIEHNYVHLTAGLCFNCDFWRKIIDRERDWRDVVIAGEKFKIGDQTEATPDKYRGYGGRKFRIEILATGEIVQTVSLWREGTVPERFRELLPDNAKFV